MSHPDAFAVLIAGPTASGKSASALAIAGALGGEIINADAIQVYRDLQVLTARPSAEEEAIVPHHLYGVMDGAESCSAGRWARMAAMAIEDCLARGKVPVLVGGTGLYFKALEEGFSPIPEIDPWHRAAGNARYEEIGAAAFHAEVAGIDPPMSALPPGDRQRLVRAFEVWHGTNRTLSDWQKAPRVPLLTIPARKAVLLPPRELLYQRCDKRLEQMLEEGAAAEVEALLARDLSPDLPVMKALGVPELAGWLRAERSFSEALTLAQMNTRRFAKRQTTWFRNQTAHWDVAETPEALSALLLDAGKW